ncbi:YebC/PmpR family DNA-binding transcriptional regulator [Engelhardtia mirabilis]|uniref:YebC/PmpR family DNA-binding transcriptional regulator n=1 Tax=Engelhardtia mirabilis TaxID=2528011 RepID=UPI0011886A83|nr:putative transcriptional regulatory protein [Planctomycetes bacterium Pla86]
MAGHSHAANVARRKNSVDAKRAKIFSKCAKAIISAVKQGGPDPDQNLKLRYAIEKAKGDNMPKDNIQRAIKSASGDKGGEMEELIYEGYAPGGVAVMVTALTDNRARTASDLKHIFDKRGGNMGSPGSVGFLFQFRSVFVVETGERDEDELTELALEVGCDDVQVADGAATFFADPTEFLAVKDGLEAAGLAFISAEIGYVPENDVEVQDKGDAKKILALVDALEDNDDVQNVYANFSIDDEWIDELTR